MKVFDKRTVLRMKGFIYVFFFSWTGVVQCQGLVGHSVDTAPFPGLLQLPALFNVGWMREAWLTVHMSSGNIHVGRHVKGSLDWHWKSMPCRQNCFFLVLESWQFQGSECCSLQEAWQRTQETCSSLFTMAVDWVSHKPNLKFKSLYSTEVVYLMTEFQSLKMSFLLGGEVVGNVEE